MENKIYALGFSENSPFANTNTTISIKTFDPIGIMFDKDIIVKKGSELNFPIEGVIERDWFYFDLNGQTKVWHKNHFIFNSDINKLEFITNN